MKKWVCLATLAIATLSKVHGEADVSSPCADYGSCDSCAAATHLNFDCLWCPLDNECHTHYSAQDPCSKGTYINNPRNCPAVTPTRQSEDYNKADSLSCIIFSDAVYEIDPSKLPGFPSDVSIYANIHGYNVDNTKIASFVGLQPTPPGMTGFGPTRVIVAFRGTDSFKQLLSEVGDFKAAKFYDMNGVYVHDYFWKAYQVLKPRTQTAFNQALDIAVNATDGNQKVQVLVCGHSLGGGLASLFSTEIAYFGDLPSYAQMSLYTIGQPRTGNKAYATLHNNNVFRSFRLINDRDTIPHLPPLGLTQSPDLSPELYSAYHHGWEVWYPSGQYQNQVLCGFRMCTGPPIGEDSSCSDHLDIDCHKILKGCYPDHHAYFNVVPNGFCQPQGLRMREPRMAP